MLLIILAFILIVAISVIYHNFSQCNADEGFAGAMIQLTAKGPQDSYLTVGTDQYVPEYYYPYGEALWNNPTRIYNYQYYYPYYYPSGYPSYYYPYNSSYLFPYTSFW